MPPIGAVTLPVALFDHNWAGACSLESSWQTDAQDALSADESRRGAVGKPYRLQRRRGLTLARAQVGALMTQARKTTGNRFYCPLGCDVSYIRSTGAPEFYMGNPFLGQPSPPPGYKQIVGRAEGWYIGALHGSGQYYIINYTNLDEGLAAAKANGGTFLVDIESLPFNAAFFNTLKLIQDRRNQYFPTVQLVLYNVGPDSWLNLHDPGLIPTVTAGMAALVALFNAAGCDNRWIWVYDAYWRDVYSIEMSDALMDTWTPIAKAAIPGGKVAWYLWHRYRVDGSGTMTAANTRRQIIKATEVSGIVMWFCPEGDTHSLDEAVVLWPAIQAFLDAFKVTMMCDTTNRRFFVGFKAMVIIFDKDKRASNIHVGTIRSLSPWSLTFIDGETCPFDVPAGSHVAPAMECDIDIQITANVITDTYVTFDLEDKERVGATALPALVGAETAAGEPTYNGVPIFNIPHDWTQMEIGETRKNIQTTVGLETVPEVYGNSSLVYGLLSFKALNRPDAFRLLRFLEGRCGGLFSYWLSSKTSDLEVVSFNPFIVKKSIAAADMLERRFICVHVDETPNMRRITAAVDNGNDTVTLTLDSLVVLPSTYTETRCSFAALAKFASDSFREDWQTDGTMSGQIRVVGVPVNSCHNGEVGDNNCDVPPEIDPPDPTDPIDPWEPHECGNPSVAVPMYQDCTIVKNSFREPVRAADLNMPGQIQVKFKEGFLKDGAHTHGPALSAEMFEALIKNHALNYVGLMTGNSHAISRNPYHLRVGGSNPSDPNTWGWGMPALPGIAVTRHLWQRIINYSVGVTTYTLDIRFVAEWSEGSAGHWGTIFYIVVFCNEVNPSYSEGSAFAAHNNATHFRNDPFVWGNYYFPGEPDKKLAHPQALFIAHAATSWHSPCGYDWFSPDNIRWKSCYSIINGSPWSGNDPEFCFRNTHFGQQVGVINAGAMTLGGSFPTSEFFEWMCIENGNATGLTALRPIKAGWNETVGDLTPEIGNEIDINVCNPGQNLQRLNPCHGHPDDRLGGVGGSHTCWRSSGSNNYLCYPTDGFGEIIVYEHCKTITTTFGPFNPSLGHCDPVTQTCSINQYKNPFVAVLYDYFLAYPPAVVDVRSITFKGFYDDPDYTREHWVYVDPDSFDDWLATSGTWAKSVPSGPTPARFTNTSIDTGNLLKAFIRYEPPDNPAPEDWKLGDGTIKFVLKDTTAIAGVALRLYTNGSGYQGYVLAWDNTLKTMTIYRIVNNVLSIRAATLVTDTMTDRFFEVFISGSKMSMKTPRQVGGGGEEDDWIVEADDCTHQADGQVGFVVLNNVAGSIFQNVEVHDNNWRKREAMFFMDGSDQLHGSVAQQICEIHIGGECQLNETCSGECNCEERSQSNISMYGASSLDPYVVGLNAASPDNCDEDPCPPNPACSSCPGPAVFFAIKLHAGCFDPEEPSTSPFKEGLSAWRWENIVCP